jgi:hypothetical protein
MMMCKLEMYKLKKNVERERIYERSREEHETWKEFFFYGLYGTIKKEAIFSKLPRMLINRESVKSFDNLSNLLKNFFLIPILVLWRIAPIRFERVYCKMKYPAASTLADIKTENFDYLFVLNTQDHIINAIPVLEKLEGKANCLVVMFKSVYNKYRDDFDNLSNVKVLFFEYELKNLPLAKYLIIIKESDNKFRLLKSRNLGGDLKQLIEFDRNFIKLYLKKELIQYHLFKEIFSLYNLKGVVSIVYTTAFQVAKEKNIPTFILQHGIGGEYQEHPFASDYIIAFDEFNKEGLNKWLDNTVEVLSLGTPRFEYLKSIAASKRDVSNFNKRIGCSRYKRNVTYVSIGDPMENKKLFMALKKLRKELSTDVNFIVKSHPREIFNTKKEIKKTFSKEELKRTTFIKTEVDFYDILANSDVTISTVSTGMSESIAMDIPTLQVNFTGHPYSKDFDFSSFGWKEPIDDPNILINETLSILSDKKKYEKVIEKQRWLKNRMFTNFGNCGEIIAHRIVDICNKNKR